MTWKCKDFMKKSIEDRSKFLAKNKLCYGSYMPISSDHNARSCKQRRVCTICKEKHRTGLYGNKHPRKSKLGDNSTNSNENSMTCASTKMKSRVVSIVHLSKIEAPKIIFKCEFKWNWS